MTNPIKIYSVVSKGCIFFDGSTVTPKFLGTVECEAHPTLTDRVIIYRTDRVSRVDSNSFRKLFRKLNIARIQNVQGEYLVEDLGYDRDEVVAYINAEANSVDVPTSGQSFAPGTSVDFYRDETSTSILFSNGDHHGVNSIKAVVKENGRIGILTMNADVELYEYDYEDVSIDGASAGNNVQTVANSLNALFTVSAVPVPLPSPTFDLSDQQALVWNSRETINPADVDELFGASGSSYHGARVWTTETISQPGEYFTFLARNVALNGGALMGIGLYDASTKADPNQAVSDDLLEILDDNLSNSGRHGYWFSNWFYNYSGYTAPWTTYGDYSGLVYGPGWNGPTDKQFRYSDPHDAFRGTTGQAMFRCGITDEGFVGVWYYDDGEWVLTARSGTPLPEGDYGLLVKLANNNIRITSQPGLYALAPEAPTLYYRYIESPDGNFNYPLFSSEEEANYVDLQNGGTGTSHAHVYADDVTNTTWYMPDTGSTMSGASAPIVPGITYTEIPSLTNADQTPPAFSGLDLTVDEGGSVNYQTQPQDTAYTTTFSGLPAGLIDANGGMIQGTAPVVTGDNVANPSDTYSVTVTRTNSYGSSTGTFNIIVNNLTAPIVAPISGVTFLGGTPMTDADTMGDGSAVAIDNVVDDGNRLVLNKEWLDNVVLPAITSGTGTKAVLVGFPQDNADWSSVTTGDFKSCYMFYATDASRAANNWRLAASLGGANNADVGIGSLTSGLYDYVFINDGDTIQQGALVASEGHDASTTEFEYATLPWRWTLEQSGHGAGSKQMVIATSGCELDLDLSYFNEYVEPTPAVANLTPWTKALDFSGSSERAQMVSTGSYYNPLMMGGLGTQINAPGDSSNTASATSARPWATACVFKTDGSNSNQHIWNAGEGVNGDNIYLRVAATGNLYFGWGRDGSGVNECLIGNGFTSNVGTNQFYGVYVAHNGTRTNSSNATASKLADMFDIYIMRLNDAGTEWETMIGALSDAEGNRSIASNWTSTGYRMDRSTTGALTIGGRGANRSFNGKVASMVVTTLKRAVAMPTKTEAETMITDPVKWLADYKAGNTFRMPNNSGNTTDFQVSQFSAGYYATQVWLMGDSSLDNYTNMIRNYVNPYDQNYTKLNLISMQSNDIQTVTIPGLSD